jgi:segregation and condensation protein A
MQAPTPVTGTATVLPATASVAIGDGRSPEADTRVVVGEWEGPLGLLLALIESRELDVLTVPLGSLAEAYLDAIAAIEEGRLGHISTFVSVAAALILIKSRSLIAREEPTSVATPEGEPADPEEELRARLILYKAFRDAGQRLDEIAMGNRGLFTRDPGAAAASGRSGARAADLPPLDPGILAAALDGIARVAPQPEPPPEIVRRMVTIEERIAAVRAALAGANVIVLGELLAGVRDRVVVAVTFLALLELAKRREIDLEQAEPFGPIVARARS